MITRINLQSNNNNMMEKILKQREVYRLYGVCTYIYYYIL